MQAKPLTADGVEFHLGMPLWTLAGNGPLATSQDTHAVRHVGPHPAYSGEWVIYPLVPQPGWLTRGESLSSFFASRAGYLLYAIQTRTAVIDQNQELNSQAEDELQMLPLRDVAGPLWQPELDSELEELIEDAAREDCTYDFEFLFPNVWHRGTVQQRLVLRPFLHWLNSRLGQYPVAGQEGYVHLRHAWRDWFAEQSAALEVS